MTFFPTPSTLITHTNKQPNYNNLSTKVLSAEMLDIYDATL